VRMIVLGIVVIVLGIALVAIGIDDRSRAPTRAAETSARDARHAMHEAMMSEIGIVALHAIPFKNYSVSDAEYGRVTTADLEQERRDIERCRAWALTLEDGPVKLAYLGWCQNFENAIPEVEAEIRTHAKRDAETQDRAHIRELAATLPKPP
jgi:hypothetical protein